MDRKRQAMLLALPASLALLVFFIGLIWGAISANSRSAFCHN